MDAGLLAVKGPKGAKRRLAGHFNEAELGQLVEALFLDALELCASVTALQWWVVSDDAGILSRARAEGFGSVVDPGMGLNAAVGAAVSSVTELGAESLTILPGDVPLAWRGDIEDLLDTGATSDVVVVPSGNDGGTNALFLSPPAVIPPSFGPSSLLAHMNDAGSRGLRCAILSLPRLALDIDTIADVEAFMQWPNKHPSNTLTILERITRS